jgi:hypothetical protein
MKPSVLVVYFSQSGQLRTIIDNMLSPVKDQLDVTYSEIELENPFPFPWSSDSFFDAMPECVEEIPSPIKPMSIPDKNYDLVILGYQPWFLSPSVPTTSFLRSEYAKVLKGKPVLTVVGCRNMWLNAQERIKASLENIGARIVGNIVFADTNHNLVALFTIIRWMFTGKKEASGMLPEAGVQTADINAAKRFGSTILNSLQTQKLDELQPALLAQKAVELKPTLIVLERRGITNFRKFAKYIREKGDRGNPERRPRVMLFKRLLLTGIFVLSPISGATAKLQSIFKKRSFKSLLSYFKGIEYKQGVI